MKNIYEQGFINGFSVAIVNENGTLYQKGFGFADVEAKREYSETTIQPIGSISKTLIGVALLRAQEMGKLELDDPVNKHLPFQVYNPYYPEEDITIRQLTNHTSTILDTDYYWKTDYILKEEHDVSDTSAVKVLNYFNPPGDSIILSDLMEEMLHEKGEGYQVEGFLDALPGKTYRYSNTGAALAAVILEITTGVSFNNFTQEHILSPLDMHSSGWSTQEVNTDRLSKLYANSDSVYADYYIIDYPAGGFITSSSDLGKYLTELIKGYLGQGTLLNLASYRELYSLPVKEDIFAELEGQNVNPVLHMRLDKGIFMGLAPYNHIGHSGGDPGVVALMYFNTQHKLGRVLIVNATIDGEHEGALSELWQIWDKLQEYQSELSSAS